MEGSELRQTRNGLFALTLGACAALSVHAQAPDRPLRGPQEGTFTGEGYFEKKDQGWFWKVHAPEEPEEAEAPEAPPAPPPLPEPFELQRPPSVAAEPVGPVPLSAAWLRDALPRYMDRAYDNPSPDNVAAYLYLQRLSIDRAEQFALQAQRVVLSDPVLDENTRRPVAMAGADVVDELAAAAAEAAVAELAETTGLWYFYRSDCPYCKAQNPMLANFQRKTNMAIMPIALDNAPMPDGIFPEWVPNRGQAETLGVQVTPTLYLVKPPGEIVLVSAGMVAETSLRERMIQAAHEAGWLSDETFNATRAVNRIYVAAEPATVPQEALENPARLVELLRASVSGGGLNR